MISMLFVLGAFAANPDPSKWPVAGTVDLPGGDLVRVELGADWLGRCPDPASYLLLDGQGKAIPFAFRTSDESPPARTARLPWTPRLDPLGRSYEVEAPDPAVPVQALRVARVPEGLVMRVRVRKGEASTDALLWNLPGTAAGSRTEIDLPSSLAKGPWQVDVAEVGGAWTWRRPGWLDFDAVFDDPWSVRAVDVPAEVGAPLPSGDTTTDLPFTLPRAGLPVRALRLAISDDLFSRSAAIHDGSVLEGGSLVRSSVERVLKGTIPVDATVLGLSTDAAPQSLFVRFEDGRSEPLHVTGVTAQVRGAILLVPEPPQTTARVLACGDAGGTYDIQRLSGRMASWEVARVRPTPPLANDAWSAGAVAGELAGPGAIIDPGAYRVRRPIDGGAGLLTLDLGVDDLAEAVEDLSDIRVVDAAGHQVPYLLERKKGAKILDKVQQTREEDGAVTLLHVTLPFEGIPVTSLVLRTARGTFERTVTVWAGEKRDKAIQSARWSNPEAGPTRVVLVVNRRLPRQIVVAIDNGDNAPLPADAVEVVVPSASLRFLRSPEAALSLLYGSSTVASPSYDLAFLRQAMLQGPARVATLGPAEAKRPRPEVTNRWAIVGGVGLLAVALLALIVRLVGKEAA